MDESIDSEEMEKLEIWANKHPENKQLLAKLQKQGSYENWLSELDKVDVCEGWQKIEEKKAKLNRRRFRQTIIRYAAVIVIALLAGGIVYYSLCNQISQETVVVAKNEIQPGARKAELVLSNGQVVRLGEGTECIKEADGTEINNDKEVIAYKEEVNSKNNEELINEIRVRQGEEFHLILADGTRVWINSMSKLRYPVHFKGKQRIVEVVEGEVCFDVKPDAKHPFIVKTPVHNVEVMGTTFNVCCYQNDQTVQTTLLEGKVQINNGIGGLGAVDIKPNQQYVFNKKELKGEILEVEASSYLAWTTGYFQFEEENLDQIFKKLERWYDIDIFFINAQRRNELFTGRLPRFEDVDVLLGMIEQVSQVKIERDGKIVKIN
ncbi:MAG: FecR domain-containing protein [Carboxylicivirga sp.]|jgi:ferric-dicitrate binding protein FerR (iron transport regulator)|nr:FecR domain-containing protein [Carboxylicivirga sp.]